MFRHSVGAALLALLAGGTGWGCGASDPLVRGGGGRMDCSGRRGPPRARSRGRRSWPRGLVRGGVLPLGGHE
jgi:hypothetical protein